MDLFDLLAHPVFGEELCKTLSFEDAIRIQMALGKDYKIPCNIQVVDGVGHVYNFKEINPETIRIYRLIKNKDAEKIFINSARTGEVENVRWLLEIGVDVNARGYHGDTALIAASFAKDIEIVRILLDKNADVNIVGGFNNTALFESSQNRTSEIAKLLVEKGANVNFVGADGMTPLMGAAGWGNIELVKLLLEKKADVNVVSEFGQTALMFAIRNNYRNIAELLKSAGAH